MKSILKNILISSIFLIAIYQRLGMFSQVGKDIYAYERAVVDLLEGRNPYIWTVESFSNPDDPGNHGFAYLPGLIYINLIGYLISLFTKIPFEYLWKIPVLLADIGVGILIIKILKNDSNDKFNFIATILGLLVWFFNPYFFFKQNYVYTDPIPVFLMLLSLYFLEKDDVLSGSIYAMAVGVKTFPLLLLPIYLFLAKDKIKFFLASAIVGLTLSIPFMSSLNNFLIYLRGALFVHGERFVQGRPFLFYVSYFYNIEFFQIIPFRIYTLLASFSGWVLVTLIYFKKWIVNKYVLSLISFLTFYLFTPVLNRTYLIWFIPILIIGMYNLRKFKLYIFGLGFFWTFYYLYLLPWKDGFHIWRP